MHWLRQFSIIAAVSFLGELLNFLIPLPVPASVWGLLLMLGALMSGVVKTHQVKDAAGFLIEIMPVMFLPAGVGLLTAWDTLRPVWIPVLLITLVTTVLVMGVSGRMTQWMMAKRKGKE